MRTWGLLVLLLFGIALCLAAPLNAAPRAVGASSVAPAPGSLQAAFAAAAAEFGVPERLLLAVSYNVSRWEQHGGAPSFAGGYGPMHLTQVSGAALAKGDDRDRAHPLHPNDPALHTLDAAAALLGLPADALKSDATQNIRGGAALLAQYARDTIGTTPANESDWYGAVAKYSGSQESSVALGFADMVFATIQRG